MANSVSRRKNNMKASSLVVMSEAAPWLCAVMVLGLILVASHREKEDGVSSTVRGNQLLDRPCDEIYVVSEGETLHTISDKCGDPFIVERNPHIHDPDDVFPGLVIKIVSPNARTSLMMK